MAGENIVAVAARLGISPQTARTHVKHIFEKTYTARQPELMKLLMSVSRRKWPTTSAASAEASPLRTIGSMQTSRSGSAGADD